MEVDPADSDDTDHDEIPKVKMGDVPEAGSLTVTVADAAGLPSVVVNVTVAVRAAAVGFGCAVKVTG